jgi:hypothetical protein
MLERALEKDEWVFQGILFLQRKPLCRLDQAKMMWETLKKAYVNGLHQIS